MVLAKNMYRSEKIFISGNFFLVFSSNEVKNTPQKQKTEDTAMKKRVLAILCAVALLMTLLVG